MKAAADKAGVTIVTGDTKVVPKGKGDKIFINTSGIGVIPEGVDISASNCRVGDKIIVNGLIGDHGAAILNARGDLALDQRRERFMVDLSVLEWGDERGHRAAKLRQVCHDLVRCSLNGSEGLSGPCFLKRSRGPLTPRDRGNHSVHKRFCH